MSPELEERIYQDVVRGVMWDENRDGIFQMLQTNGIIGEQAEGMFQRARKERIALLRGEGVRRSIKGIFFAVVGVGVFCGFWFGLGFIMRSILILCVALCGWGVWSFAAGLIDVALAPVKKGSVAD